MTLRISANALSIRQETTSDFGNNNIRERRDRETLGNLIFSISPAPVADTDKFIRSRYSQLFPETDDRKQQR